MAHAGRTYTLRSITVDRITVMIDGGYVMEILGDGAAVWEIMGGTDDPEARDFGPGLHDVTVRTVPGLELVGRARIDSGHPAPGETAYTLRFEGVPRESHP